MNNLNIRRPFSALMNLSHLVRAFDFTLTGFLTKLIYMFFKSKVTINCYAKKLSLELPCIMELLILMDFTLKGDKNK